MELNFTKTESSAKTSGLTLGMNIAEMYAAATAAEEAEYTEYLAGLSVGYNAEQQDVLNAVVAPFVSGDVRASEGLNMGSVKSFGEKALEKLKELWARFKQALRSIILRITDNVGRYLKLVSKVGAMGSSIEWRKENLTTKYDTTTKLPNGKTAVFTAAEDIAKELLSGKWDLKANDSAIKVLDGDSFYKELRESTKTAKGSFTVKILATSVSKAISLGSECVEFISEAKTLEKTLSRVSIKALKLEDNTVKPNKYVARASRACVEAILVVNGILGSCVKVLNNVKKKG